MIIDDFDLDYDFDFDFYKISSQHRSQMTIVRPEEASGKQRPYEELKPGELLTVQTAMVYDGNNEIQVKVKLILSSDEEGSFQREFNVFYIPLHCPSLLLAREDCIA